MHLQKWSWELEFCCGKKPLAGSASAQIHERGGATYITSWGKFWLSVLGVFKWEGQNPLNPEMWLLPYSAWSGVGWLHPGRFWCHCRMVRSPAAPCLALLHLLMPIQCQLAMHLCAMP